MGARAGAREAGYLPAMGYVLYGANGSGSSIVETTLAEIGTAFEVRLVDARHGEHRQAAYAAINPQRKLPTLLTPAGGTLTESAAIVVTLAERHPSAQLLPAPGSPERAVALRWLMFVATELYPVVEIIDHPERFAPDEASRPGVRELALAKWRERWQVVEGELGEGPYLLGDTFCVTDIYLAALSRWDLDPQWRCEHLPKLQRLAETVAARPRIAPIWPRHFPNG